MDDNNKIGSVNENMQVDEVLEASSETDMGVNTNQAAETVVPKDANTMKERDMGEVMAHQRVMKVVVQVLLYLFLCLMAIGVLFPFYWMIISSLKSFDEYQLFVNTVYVGIVSTVLSLVITVLAAFAFARLEFKGKNIMFGALLATMMIPGELFTITNFTTVVSFGWRSTFIVLIVPFLVSVFYIYLLRQNFMQIPDELYYAAKVDGTSDLKYLWKVMIPLALPTIISITILKMMGAWNSYVWPRLVVGNKDILHSLITNGLRGAEFPVRDPVTGALVDGQTNIPQQMAAVAMVSLPLFLVFIFLRKYIMKGVSRSGIKG